MGADRIERICERCFKPYESNNPSKRCPPCRIRHQHEREIIAKFGTLDIEFKCVVCGFETEYYNELTGHHIISRQIDPEGPTIPVCGPCHKAIHQIRKSQKKPLTEEGLKKFGELVNKCTTRMMKYY